MPPFSATKSLSYEKKSKDMKKSLGYFLVIFASVSWGFIGVFNRMLASTGINVWTRMCIRNTGSLVLCLVLFSIFKRSVFRINPRHLPMFFCSGVLGIVGATVTYMSCQMMCSLAVAGILLYLAPTFVVLASAVLWKAPLTPRRVAAVVLALIGCAFVSGVVGGSLTASLPGLLLGIGSGLCYGGYTIFSHYNLARYDAYTSFFWSIAMAGLVSLAGFNAQEMATVFSQPKGILGALGLVVIGTVLPFLTYTIGLTAIESGLASVIANVEPVTAAVLGVVLFHETLTVWTMVGIVLVLTAAVMLAVGEKKKVQEAT